MHWFYERNGKQAGPVTEQEFDQLVQSGAIQEETLVWNEGMSDWQPLRMARPQLSSPHPIPQAPDRAPASHQRCAECHQMFPEREMLFLNRLWVCAQCKPILIQRFKEGAMPASGTAWRAGRQMIMRPEMALPDRCVKCNAPANGYRLKRNLYWHSWVIYLLVLINLLVYLLVALFVRKRAVIHVGVCEAHRKHRYWTILGSWIGVLAGLGVLGAGIAKDSVNLILMGGIIFVASALFGAVRAALVSPAKIDREFVWVKGVNRAYLDELPEWGGPS
jgi:hypothetical protein